MENISLNVRQADVCKYLLTLWETGLGIIHSSDKYLLRAYYVPGILLGTGDASVNKQKISLFSQDSIEMEQKKQETKWSTANGGDGNMTEKTKAVYGVAESPALLF